MASTISNSAMQISFSAQLAPNNPALPPSITISSVFKVSPGAGGSSGNVDGIYTITGSVTSGSPVTIDLTALTFPVGDAITVAKLSGISVQNTNTSGGTLTVGGGTNPIFAAFPALGFGDVLGMSFNQNPLTVTGASTNNLKLVASSATVTYAITIFTRSA